MKYLFLITGLAAVVLVVSLATCPAPAQTPPQTPAEPNASNAPSIPLDQVNARKARALIDQAIQALGGQAFLAIQNIEQQGRTYTFYHGRPTSNGVVFWRFVEYPDKERIELTQQRDVAAVYIGNKGYEITYKGPHAVEKKDLDDYLRRRRLSLETIFREWINDPSVAFFYEGNALAGNLPALKVTLINSKDEAVSLYFDIDSHLPLEKSYVWRDPIDRFRNTEEEIYDNYRPAQGVMIPWGFTRYFNGDMQTQRFVSAVKINQGLDQTMFDPNSNYNPIKAAAGKH